MNRRDAVVNLCEKNFILEAIKDNRRVDGREVYDYRDINIALGKEPGCVEVTLGKTRVLACVTCQVIHPKPQRPTEGVLFFNVELSPMASPSFEMGKHTNTAIEINRILERCQKESRAVDTESLCIIAGQMVWEIRIDLHVLDHCGNIIDCASIAAITALKHFRHPDVTVVGEEATIHPVSERDPVALSVHHMPICFTFAFFWDGEYMLVDPSLEEELVMEGKLVVGMNIHRDICVLQIVGGVSILPEQVMRCTQIAAVKCVETTELIKGALLGKEDYSSDFESIFQSKQKMEIPEESHVEFKDKMVEGEQMEIEESSKDHQVNYLGPGTAELIGLGGDSTWMVLDSIEEWSEEEETSPKELQSCRQGKCEVKNKVPLSQANSDSEEEETIQLTNTDMTGLPEMDSKSDLPLASAELASVRSDSIQGTKKTRTNESAAARNRKVKRKGKAGGNDKGGKGTTVIRNKVKK